MIAGLLVSKCNRVVAGRPVFRTSLHSSCSAIATARSAADDVASVTFGLFCARWLWSLLALSLEVRAAAPSRLSMRAAEVIHAPSNATMRIHEMMKIAECVSMDGLGPGCAFSTAGCIVKTVFEKGRVDAGQRSSSGSNLGYVAIRRNSVVESFLNF